MQFKSNSKSGVAIVIVLAFVVLVTGLIVAFFSRSILDRQISSSSASQTKGELFAQGAFDTTLADLKQEIVDGSGTSSSPKYLIATAASNMVPSLSVSTGSNGLENLLKISGTAPFYPGGGTRAGTTSTLTPSLNGRFITAARWNKPLLMPVTGTSDYTPKLSNGATFTPPNWILVARDGANPNSWSNSLKISRANSASVVGRYAYAIYNEGGLLDANVAGYPSTSATNQYGYKQALAYADLRQIGLSLPDIDKLVAWRNYASTKAPGLSFNNPGFTRSSASSYYQSVTANTNGFLATGTDLNQNQTDRAFISRQQLLNFLQNGLGLSVTGSAFQCLSTFSRAINQPSLAPDFINPSSPSYRKRVVDSGGRGGTAGNSSFGDELLYNPKFLEIRVTDSFDRNDGTTAQIGEPLVKKRFPLSTLAWVTYKGASATVPSSDPVISAYLGAGLSQEFLNLGTDGSTGNIHKYFGLVRIGGTASTGYWSYNNGVTSAGVVKIGTLAEASAANREPDFFELLKASINVGSIGKASATGLASPPGDNEIAVDYRVDFQILQIGANILDQFDPDGYPTHLQIDDAGVTPSVGRDFYGKENLPYLNGLHLCATNIVSSNTNGMMMALEIPSIWNPVDVSSNFPAPGSGLAPASLRVTKFGGSPWDTVASAMRFNASYVRGSGTTQLYSASLKWNSRQDTAITFANESALYREPTLLAKRNFPANSALAMGDSFNVAVPVSGSKGSPVNDPPLVPIASTIMVNPGSPVIEKTSNIELVGWPMGAAFLSYTGSSGSLNSLAGVSGDAFGAALTGVTVRMEWSDDGVTWQPYQEHFWDQQISFPSYPRFASGPGNVPCFPILNQWNQVRFLSETPVDARSSRFNPIPVVAPSAPIWLFDTVSMRLGTIRPTEAMAGSDSGNTSTNSGYTVVSEATGLKWNEAGWKTLRSGGFVVPGSLEQNNPLAYFFNDNNITTPVTQYYTDPDGVARRAMAAYVPTGGASSPIPATTATGLPLASPSFVSSRPVMLNRPFRNVGELGYVFRDTPWKNLDFFTPESGDSGLLDLFCIAPDNTAEGVVAGKVNLNTRQAPVLQAIIAGALRDELSGSTLASGSIASALIARTTGKTGATGPLTNLSDLVGRFTGVNNAYGQPYDGFSADLGAFGSTSPNDVIQRFRESSIRALAQVGDVRTWTLMIDLVAQTGCYPQSASGLDQFMVESEQRYWVHLAIDRATGQVIDKQIELAKE